MNKIETGVWYIDKILDGGLKQSHTYEICGYPWEVVKDHIHYITPNLALEDKVIVLYGQYFDGLNPYRIAKYSRIYGIDYSKVKNRVKIARGFKGEDYIDGVKRLEKLDGIAILVDPYLHAYMTSNRKLFGYIASEIYKLKRMDKTVIIFNRLMADGKPLGGEFHRHIPDYIIQMIYREPYLHLSLIKSLDTRNREIIVKYSIGTPTVKREIQHSITEWIR